jgi:hypothetical protein
VLNCYFDLKVTPLTAARITYLENLLLDMSFHFIGSMYAKNAWHQSSWTAQIAQIARRTMQPHTFSNSIWNNIEGGRSILEIYLSLYDRRGVEAHQ